MSQLADPVCVTSTSKPNKARCWNPCVLDPELNLSAPGFKWIAEVLKVVPSCEIKFSCLWCKRFAMFLDPDWCLFNPWQHHRLLSAASRWTDETLNRESLSGRMEEAAAAAATSISRQFILHRLTPAHPLTAPVRMLCCPSLGAEHVNESFQFPKAPFYLPLSQNSGIIPIMESFPVSLRPPPGLYWNSPQLVVLSPIQAAGHLHR